MDSGQLRQQEAEQGLEQSLAALAGVVNELEEAQIQRQLLLRDTPVGAEPRAQ